MFFLPLWVVLLSVPCVYAAARYTKSSLATLSVSFAFLSSGAIVLCSISRISSTVSTACLGGLLPLEISKFSVLVSLTLLICSMAFIIYFLSSLEVSRLSGAATLLHLLIFFALASFYSKGLLAFAIFFEAVPLLALALVTSEGDTESSPWQNLLYCLPLPLFLVSAGLMLESAPDTHSIMAPTVAACILAVVCATGLLFFPFGWPALVCLPLGRRLAASYGLCTLPTVALFALIRFLPYSSFLGHAMLGLAAFSMVVWATLCYMQRREESGILYGYLAQTATVVVIVTYSMMDIDLSGGVSFAVIGNHIVSSLGVLLCASAGAERRGRFANAALIFFMFCMLGLPPSPGFFGRLALFRASVSATDVPSYLLRLSFLVNLFIVYCQSRYLAVVVRRTGTVPRTPRSLIVSLLLLVACLVLVFHWRSL